MVNVRCWRDEVFGEFHIHLSLSSLTFPRLRLTLIADASALIGIHILMIWTQLFFSRRYLPLMSAFGKIVE
jgi:hypothetical protein